MREHQMLLTMLALVVVATAGGLVFFGCQDADMPGRHDMMGNGMMRDGMGNGMMGNGTGSTSGISAPAGSSAAAQAGAKVLASQGCLKCHTINGQGGKVGPDLSNEANKGRSEAWLAQQLRDSKSHYAQSVMPSYAQLSDAQINDLVAYLLSLSTEAAKKQAS